MLFAKRQFFQTFQDTLKISGGKGRTGFYKSLFLSSFNSFLEVFTLASAIPLILYYISRPEKPEGRFAEVFESILQYPLFNESIVNVLLLLAMILLLKNVIGVYISYFQMSLCYGVASNLSAKLLEKYYEQPYLQFAQSNSGEHHNEINNVPTLFAYNILLGYVYIFSELTVVIILSTALIIVSPYIFLLVTLFLVSISLLALWLKNRYARKISNSKRSYFSSTSKALMKALDGYVAIRLFRKQSFFVDRYSEKLKPLQALSTKDQVLQTVPMRVLEMAGFLGVIIIIFLFSKAGKSATEMATILGLFATAAYRIIPSFNRLISRSVTIKSNLYLLEILKNRLFSTKDSTDHSTEKIDMIKSLAAVQIALDYGDKSVLKGVSFTINAGDIFGISGTSGSGKTTLINVLIGLLEPHKGHVLLNGKPFSPYENPRWFEKIALVGQNPLMIDGSIAANIAFGSHTSDIDYERMKDSLRQVGLAKFCSEETGGLHKETGENGLQLSGGEKRRIALARALYRDSEVLFFDEITNDLDVESAELIYTLLEKLSKRGKIVIWVTHDQRGLDICTHTFDLRTGSAS
ncbi:MAG: ABC transporter ATP-binding protein [Roseivirga sp.]|nr:ABC transporter ATP-binding protein [Roseivirga sp.]